MANALIIAQHSTNVAGPPGNNKYKQQQQQKRYKKWKINENLYL